MLIADSHSLSVINNQMLPICATSIPVSVNSIPFLSISGKTDNGSENLGIFDELLKKENIKHLFSYPHCPKINSYIERYNRTIKEEFLNHNLQLLLYNPVKFSNALADYLLYYNYKRPHKSLNLNPPLFVLLKNCKMSHMYRTHTRIWMMEYGCDKILMCIKDSRRFEKTLIMPAERHETH